MAYEYNKEAFNEQVVFLDELAQKLELSSKDDLGGYLINCMHNEQNYKKEIIFLNLKLESAIKNGKLKIWVMEESKKLSTEELEQIYNINYFWNSYLKTLEAMGLEKPFYFDIDEIAKLDSIPGSYEIPSGGICDFHESSHPHTCSNDDDGSTVFSYDGSRRII